MRLTRRDAAKLGLGLAAFRMGLGGSGAAEAQTEAPVLGSGIRVHGHSLVAPLRYGPDFPKFDYVNPDAPKGGTVHYDVGPRFDNLNYFNRAGAQSVAVVLGDVIETLMAPSLDEGSTHYGLLAEWMESPEDDSWVAFRLRDGARWHDGRPITVEDVLFSFEVLTTKGRPFFGSYYAHVGSARDLGDRTVLFEFDQTGNRELPHIMGQLYVLPKHWWETRDFEEPTLEPLLGSGPYRFGALEASQFIDLDRVRDYWGANLPIRIGQNNFDRVRFSYFSEDVAAFESFKSGELHFRQEGEALKWATGYDFPAIRSGDVAKEEVYLEGPQPVSGFFFNVRRPKFADRRVREAFNLLLDFEYMNRALYFDQYARPVSYFQNTPDLMATGMPDDAELALLEPHRDSLAPDLFERPFEQPTSDGSGNLSRSARRRAAQLLDAAGWPNVDGVRTGPGGEVLSIEFLNTSASFEKTIAAFTENLEAMGVRTTVRTVDPTLFVQRRRAFDFDCIPWYVANSESPGNEQRDFWGSGDANVEGSRNFCGVSHPAIDDLIEKVVFSEGRAQLATACRALDRALLFEHYVALRAYSPFERIAYWRSEIAHPTPLPARSLGFPTVWWSNK